MFHPIGPQNPTVYWRRRLAVLGGSVLLILLIVLTFNAMRSDGANKPAARSTSPSVGSTTSSAKVVAPAASSGSSASSTSSGSSASNSAPAGTAHGVTKSSGASTHPSSSTPITNCATKQLELRAVVGKASYRVGDTPMLQLQVTNTGTAPCVQNLADSEVEMRVYNGESRVWGSHDCKIMPGKNLRTLNPRVPVLVSIEWSGLSSQPKCAGTRQRVNAGTYTLYTSLAGRTGAATQFSIG